MPFLIKREDADLSGFPMPAGEIYHAPVMYTRMIECRITKVHGPFGYDAKVMLPAGSGDGICALEFVNPGCLRIHTSSRKVLTFRPRGRRWDGERWIKA